jgi:hypothetical protein
MLLTVRWVCFIGSMLIAVGYVAYNAYRRKRSQYWAFPNWAAALQSALIALSAFACFDPFNLFGHWGD